MLRFTFTKKRYGLKKAACIITLLTGVFILPLSAQNLQWPGGKKAAIVLTYDDGLDSQLNIAIPQLDSFGFKGTFFLYSHVPEERFAAWRAVSGEGHELGNHSLFHPCKGNGSEAKSPRFSSENYDVPSILREIEVMNKLLFAITGKQPASYAYPCSETVVGGVDYSGPLRESGLVRYARTGGRNPVITDFRQVDFFKVPSFSAPAGSASDVLTGFAQEVLQSQGLGIYIFHGIGGDYLSMGADKHRALLKFLKDHSDEIWVATFSEAMAYVQENTNK